MGNLVPYCEYSRLVHIGYIIISRVYYYYSILLIAVETRVDSDILDVLILYNELSGLTIEILIPLCSLAHLRFESLRVFRFLCKSCEHSEFFDLRDRRFVHTDYILIQIITLLNFLGT